MTRVALLVAALLVAGCARNAGLEITLDLPPKSGAAEQYALVQFERPPVGFGQDWAGARDPQAFTLGAGRTEARLSVLASSTDVLRVKVRFCATPTCATETNAAPAVWYELARPFYVGQRTEWRQRIEAIPAAAPMEAIAIGKCEVGGCILAPEGSWFCRCDGTHFCEAPLSGCDGGL